MKATKIRRRSKVFRRRHVGRTIAKIGLWLLVIPALIGGYYFAQYLATRAPSEPVDTVPAVTTTAATDTTPTTVADTPVDTPADTAALSALRAIYLPTAALRDLPAWESTLAAAQNAGFNAVIFDLKDADGNLLYASATELAATARAVTDSALTLDELEQASAVLAAHQLTAVPRMFAFRDNTAPRYLETARVSVAGSPGSVWYDGNPSGGGRRWLNPYTADARRYITTLAAELKTAGFSPLMLDGVQFPEQESQANYGDVTLSKNEVLAQFVSEMNAAVGADSWLMTTTAPASVGEKTAVYGANPVTFGAPAVSPWALPSDMGSRLSLGGERVSDPEENPYEALSLLFGQLELRLRLMSQAPTPVVVPWLQAEDYSAAQIAEEVRAVTDRFGVAAPYILYRADGRYVFS